MTGSIHKGQRVLGIVFFLTLAFSIFEFLAAKLSNSLALFADAVHMLTDLAAVGLAYFAAGIASRRATPRMTYGFYRVEILSALVNGAALLAAAFFIVKEAFRRFHEAPPVRADFLMAVAFAGLMVNLASGFFLKNFTAQSINIRAAFFHVLSDALSSAGALAAGLIIFLTGWRTADPLVSCLIAFLILVSAWRLLRDVVEVLLEAAPAHLNIPALEQRILSVEGIRGIHDLHIWSITSGKESLSAHLEVAPGVDPDDILTRVSEILSKEFQVDHTTLQIETIPRTKRESRHFHI